MRRGSTFGRCTIALSALLWATTGCDQGGDASKRVQTTVVGTPAAAAAPTTAPAMAATPAAPPPAADSAHPATPAASLVSNTAAGGAADPHPRAAAESEPKSLAAADAKPAESPATPAAPLVTPAPAVKADNAAAEAKDAPKTVAPEAARQGFDPAKAPQTARLPGWYQWRGPEQNGVSREKGLPDKWDPDTGENVVWTSNVGGMSSPVIWNNKIYTWSRANEVAFGEGDTKTLAPGPKTQESLVCIDATTGKTLWTHVNNMTQTEVPFHRLGWSGPVVDPSTGRVYALGSQCWLLCLNGDSGEVIWQRQMTEEFGMISTFGGRTQTPIVDEDQCLVTGVSFGFGDNAYSAHRIFAFNKHTGALNWTASTGGIPVDAPQNTPVVTVVDGQRLVIFAAGDGGIHAFQVRTGKKVWEFKASKRGLNTSVVVDGTKLYCTHGLDNFDTNALGRIFCLDLTKIEKGSPKELWKATGIEAGFPTPIVVDKYLYVMDDRAKLYQYDKESGKQLWKKNCGTVGKPSPVWGDGKIYVADGDGKFWIIKPEATKAEVLSKVDLNEKWGREYVIYGSAAICDGRVYLQAATKLYCIGKKDAKPEPGQIPPMGEEKPKDQKVAAVQVVPADLVLRPGQSQKFDVRTFDANGELLSDNAGDKVEFAVGKLTLPPPRKPPAMPKPDASPNAAPAGAVAEVKAEPAKVEPPAAPTQVGNLAGAVKPDGTFTAEGAAHQAGAIDATVDGVKGQARVRVLPPLPWKFDFEQSPVDKPPLTWLGAGGKFAVVPDPENDKNKVVVKLNNIDLYYRARTNFGAVDMTDYTVQSDVKAHEKVIADRRYVPSGAVMNQRYVLVLDGMRQMAQIHVWPSALPDDRNPSGSVHADMPFKWDAKKWYTLKLQVTQEKDKSVAKGKVWETGTEEPKDWQLSLDDLIPNRTGNPGLFAVSLVGDQKSEVYFDNIVVTPNGK